MKIITYPASQRTFGENISIQLNKQINGIQKIVYSTDTGVFLGTMNPDGTEWTTKKIIDTEYFVRLVDVYNDEIYICIDNLYIFDVDGNIVSLINMPTGLNADFFDFNNGKIYGWTKSINVPFSVSINSVNLDGSGYETHQITARTFSSYFYFQRLGNKLVYFYASSGRLYTATSDLDCTNFVGVDRVIKPNNYGFCISSDSIAYFNFRILDGEDYIPQVGMLDSSGNFSYLPQSLPGYTHWGMFLKGSYLYQVTVGGDVDGNVYITKDDLNGNFLSMDEFILPEEPYNYLFIDFYDNNGNIYAWAQYDTVTESISLWTYPGDYIELPPLSSPHPWPIIRQNYKNTYASPYSFFNKITLKWDTQLDNSESINELLISSNNILYGITSSNNIVSIDSNGNLLWHYLVTEQSYIIVFLLGSDGNLYIGLQNGSMFSLNPTNGDLIWQFYLNGSPSNTHYNYISGGITNNNNIIYITTYSTLYAVSYNGNILWISYFTNINTTPVMDDNGIIYLFSNDSDFIVVNQNGTIKWTTTMTEVLTNTIIGSSGDIFASYYDNDGAGIIRLDKLNGSIKWKFNLFDSSYVGEYDGNIIIDNNENIYYYYGNINGYYYFDILNSDGIKIFTSNQFYLIYNFVLDSNNTVFISIFQYEAGLYSYNGIVTYNINTSNYYENNIGEIGYISGISLDAGNTVYVYDAYGKLYAFKEFIGLPQVQCRATQIIASANTGKIILAVPIL